MLLAPYKKFILDRGLLREGDGVVLAVSGGIDSMVMLDLFSRLAPPWRLALTVAHMNHGLRGRASDADEHLVREACERLGVPCEVKRQRPRQKANLQDDARRMRYRFLGEVAARSGAHIIATAHQRDDQAETILLHLIRGSGLKGLCGMTARAARGSLALIRPLLFASRREIAAYAKRCGVRSREDATNTKTAYTRNKVRHLLLPTLEQFNPRIVETLAQMGERLLQDEEALALVAEEALEDVAAIAEPGRAVLRREPLVHLPAAVRGRLLRLAFERASGSTADLNADQVARMDAIACGAKRLAEYRLPAPWKFHREDDLLRIEKSRTTHDR